MNESERVRQPDGQTNRDTEEWARQLDTERIRRIDRQKRIAVLAVPPPHPPPNYRHKRSSNTTYAIINFQFHTTSSHHLSCTVV